MKININRGGLVLSFEPTRFTHRTLFALSWGRNVTRGADHFHTVFCPTLAIIASTEPRAPNGFRSLMVSAWRPAPDHRAIVDLAFGIFA